MPIRKDLLQHYSGADWKATRRRILARAHDRCEQCGVKNHHRYDRGNGGSYRSSEAECGTPWRNSQGNITTFEPMVSARRTVSIVLTVAHLNHTPGDDREENLMALCQWCHLNYARRPLLMEAK